MKLVSGAHLGYCTNIHPGESWHEVRTAIETHVLDVKKRFSPDAAFGVGLRLSARAAMELSQGGELDAFRDLLARSDLYVFTINGFPYGAFNEGRVKDAVYVPDWREESRVEYTDRLAAILAALLPDGVDGSISTVPGAFRPSLRGAADVDAMVDRLLRHVATLVDISERTGRRITLALEPEPWCFLETSAEAVRFFEDRLYARDAIRQVARSARRSEADAERLLHEHLGICFDACHAAVAHEDPRGALDAIVAAGIPIAKVQVTTGLELEPHDDSLRALARFADDRYLHQVVVRDGSRFERYLDLPEALGSARRGATVPRELWRVHFHVPVFCESFGVLRSTQAHLREVLRVVREKRITQHLEVETYTWDVMPEEDRPGTVASALARELEWTLAQS